MAEIKRVTLHPLKSDGTMDLNVNLYPKTLLDGIVDRDGNPVDIATQEELQNVTSELSGDITENVEIINQTIQETTQHLEQEINAIPRGDVTTEQLNEALADKANEEDLESLEDILDNVQSDLTTLNNKKQNVTEISEGEFFNIDFYICSIEDFQDIIYGFTPEYLDKLVRIGTCFDNFGEVWNFDVINDSVVDVIVTNGNIIYRATVTIGKELSIEDVAETNILPSVEVPNFVLNDILDKGDLQTFIDFLNDPADFSNGGINLPFMSSIPELTYKQACKYHKLRISYYKDENVIPYTTEDDNWTEYPGGLTASDVLEHVNTQEKILLPDSSDNSDTTWWGNWPNNNGTFLAEPDWDSSAWRLDDYYDLLANAGWSIESIKLENTDEGNYGDLLEFNTHYLATKNDLGLIIAYDNNYIMCLYWFNTDTVIKEYSLYFNKNKDSRDGSSPKKNNSKSSIDEPTIIANFEYVNVEETNTSKLILSRDRIRGFVSSSGGSGDNPRIYFQFTENMKSAFGDLYNAWPIDSQGYLDPDLSDSLDEIYNYFDDDNGSHMFTEPNGTSIICSYKYVGEPDIFGNTSENEYYTFSGIRSNGLEWEVQCVYLSESSHTHINYVKVFIEDSWHYWVPHLVPYICSRSDYSALPHYLNYSYKELYAVLLYSYCWPNDRDICPYIEPIDIYDGVCTSILRSVYDAEGDDGDPTPMLILDYIKGLSFNKLLEEVVGQTVPEKYHFSLYDGNFQMRFRNPDEGWIDWDNYATPNAIKKLNLNTYTIVLRPWFDCSDEVNGWGIYSYNIGYIEFEMWDMLKYFDDDIYGNTNEETAISTLPYLYVDTPEPEA